MTFLPSDLLCCPLDKRLLRQENARLLCANGHSFDIARQGYVNLLGPGDKRSRDPGDSKEMVSARSAFLNAGHYQPVADRLGALLEQGISGDAIIVDAGCGEGYYLEQLRRQFSAARLNTPTLLGFDISKWAVQAAARRFACTWLVASNRNIPLVPASVDCILSLFGFPVYASFHALLKVGGTLLTMNAGPQHLIELREILYPSVRYSASTVLEKAQAAGFVAGESSTLHYKTAALNPLHLHQLLTMTPHLFRASAEGKQRAAQLDRLQITVDIVFQLLHKPSTFHQERHTDPDSA